jgi:hypothetical protein
MAILVKLHHKTARAIHILHVGRWISFSILAISIFVLLLWPELFNRTLFPTSILIILFALIVIALSILIVEMSEHVRLISGSVLDEKSEDILVIKHLTILAAIRQAANMVHTSRVLRIHASTGEQIIPALRECQFKVENVHLMLQNFPGEDAKSKRLRSKAEEAIRSCLLFSDQAIASRVVVKRYGFIPTSFVVIFDEHAMVFGLYFPIELQIHNVHYIDPIFVDDRTLAGRELIKKFTIQFDHIFDEFPIAQQASIRKLRK